MDLEKFRFLTAGESHGKCLTAIIDGVPAGFKIDIDFINNELKRRQTGYGRGDRMKIETDKVEITAGVRFGDYNRRADCACHLQQRLRKLAKDFEHKSR